MKSATTPPVSAGKLDKYVLAAAREYRTTIPRVRQWVSFMIMSGALDRATRTGDRPAFLIKGGVALALRLRTRARVTDDVDIIAFCDQGDPLLAVDEALATPYEGFVFIRRRETRMLGSHAVSKSRTVVRSGRRYGSMLCARMP